MALLVAVAFADHTPVFVAHVVVALLVAIVVVVVEHRVRCNAVVHKHTAQHMLVVVGVDEQVQHYFEKMPKHQTNHQQMLLVLVLLFVDEHHHHDLVVLYVRYCVLVVIQNLQI